MRILNLCFHDFAGVGYTLSHAVNKHTKHKAINLRSTSGYMAYPAIAKMRHYTVELCRKMVYKADVIVYHSVLKPFFLGLDLDPAKLRDKKNILLFHGTDFREAGQDIMKDADELIENYQVIVTTPDLLLSAPKDAKWLPNARSFSEISSQFGICNQDRAALASFGPPHPKVVFTHAPTGERKKGSVTFYRVITKMIKMLPYISFLTIRKQAWAQVLRHLPDIDVLFDQDPPEHVTVNPPYGCISIEASIFHKPVITKLTKPVVKLIAKETGLTFADGFPFVTFKDEDDLLGKAVKLAEDEKLRGIYGDLMYNYCKAVHDEKPVVDKFMRIIEGMN